MSSIEVIFGDKQLANKYKTRIENFVRGLLEPNEQSCVQFRILESYPEGKTEGIVYNTNGTPCPGMKIPESAKVPLYSSCFEETLEDDDDETEGSEIDVPQKKMQGMTCFNCLGDHHLKDCPEEHDGSRIASNKRDLMEQNTCRYHTDDTQSAEYSMLRPGRISEGLHQALGLQRTELPPFIYRMRVLGYPPGWLKEAEIETSGINVYDSCEDAARKEEEVSSREPEDKKYNGQSFIEYPGFNAPVPDGVIDEWERFGMLPLQPHQQLSEALKHTGVTVSPEYKKRKKTEDNNNEAKKVKNAVADSEDVEKQSQPDLDMSFTVRREKPGSIVPGSPVIDTGNPCKRLPDANKFSVGITEYLPYENLPDAVGQFDSKMKGVLEDVREKMTKLHNDKD